jgi:chromosome segregation ATPase
MEAPRESVKWMRYNELAAAIGIPRESARQFASRKRWPRRQGEDGRARIAVPLEVLRSQSRSAPTGEGVLPDARDQLSSDETPAICILEHHVEHLEDELEEAKRELDRTRTTLAGEAALKQALVTAFERQISETRVEIDRVRTERDGLRAECDRLRSVTQERLEVSLRAAQERAEAATQAGAKPPNKRWWRRGAC